MCATSDRPRQSDTSLTRVSSAMRCRCAFGCVCHIAGLRSRLEARVAGFEATPRPAREFGTAPRIFGAKSDEAGGAQLPGLPLLLWGYHSLTQGVASYASAALSDAAGACGRRRRQTECADVHGIAMAFVQRVPCPPLAAHLPSIVLSAVRCAFSRVQR